MINPTPQRFINFSSQGNESNLKLKGLTLFFSYSTVISFKVDGQLFISKNCWSKTTGKHLNRIDSDKSKRIDYPDFEKKLKNILTQKGLI